RRNSRAAKSCSPNGNRSSHRRKRSVALLGRLPLDRRWLFCLDRRAVEVRQTSSNEIEGGRNKRVPMNRVVESQSPEEHERGGCPRPRHRQQGADERHQDQQKADETVRLGQLTTKNAVINMGDDYDKKIDDKRDDGGKHPYNGCAESPDDLHTSCSLQCSVNSREVSRARRPTSRRSGHAGDNLGSERPVARIAQRSRLVNTGRVGNR